MLAFLPVLFHRRLQGNPLDSIHWWRIWFMSETWTKNQLNISSEKYSEKSNKANIFMCLSTLYTLPFFDTHTTTMMCLQRDTYPHKHKERPEKSEMLQNMFPLLRKMRKVTHSHGVCLLSGSRSVFSYSAKHVLLLQSTEYAMWLCNL